MSSPLTIVVGGYIVGYPLGGMTWHHLNYLLGLHALGHRVIFLEDSGSYSYPYNPKTWICDVDSTYGRAYLEKTFADFNLPIPWCYYSEFEDRHYGLSADELNTALRECDLMLCLSAVTPIRLSRPRPKRLAVIDTDPVFTQLRMSRDEKFLSYYKLFDAVATFGRLIGTPACPLPTHGINWIPTNQPIAIDHWPLVPATSRAFTTIGKWEHTTDRHLEFAGKRYHSSKSLEWMKVIDLPRQLPWEMTMGMLRIPDDVRANFESHGWRFVDPESSSIDCQSMRRFIQESAGEFTVTKEIYAGLPSGWFSDRGAAYLASGRPVVMQSSGFEQWLPTGEGLFGFTSAEQAAGALNTIAADYPTHARAARRLAEEHFDARRVLPALLQQVL